METVWDPLRRKEVAATPEERVRQWFIVQLRDCFGVPRQMMKSEVGLRFGAKSWRADILVHGRDWKPLLVVECKRPETELTAAVLEQAMRYNSVLSVRFLVVTNGKKTYLYRLEGGAFVPCERFPRYEEMICPR